MYDPRVSHSRGYLPHVDTTDLVQFITFRLADSMPQNVLAKWHAELESGGITDADLRKRIETYLDQNYGSSVLKDRRIANIVRETLLRWDGDRYVLIAWVIMPNHVHILIERADGFSVSEIMHSLKSYSAHEANRLLGRKGRFWFKEYFDRYIRNHHHLVATVKYIEENPVKARLCRNAEDWEFSSAYSRDR
jgi:REP element-mobilizing transposase RayT